MKANYQIESGENIRVIRPFVYLREKMTREFSDHASLPVINENCPACFEQPKERDRIKRLLAQEEAMVPGIFSNLRKACLPFMDNAVYETMKKINDEIASRSNAYTKIRPGDSGLNMKSSRDNSADGTVDGNATKKMKV